MDDETILQRLEEDGKNLRKARSALRKTPEAKAKRESGRKQKRRGYRSEKEAETQLKAFGFRRVPLSGSLGGSLSGDLRRDIEDGRVLRKLENKRRAGGFKTLYDWLQQGDGNDFVRIDSGGRREALYVIPEAKMLMLLEEAGYRVNGDGETQS